MIDYVSKENQYLLYYPGHYKLFESEFLISGSFSFCKICKNFPFYTKDIKIYAKKFLFLF